MPPKKKRGLPPGALHHVERKYFKVLFCGEEFPAGAEETRKALEKHDAVGNCEFRFVACARELKKERVAIRVNMLHPILKVSTDVHGLLGDPV